MIGLRTFVRGAAALSAGAAMLVACGDDEPRASRTEEPDAADTPETSLPPTPDDAGAPDGDAATPKPDYDASDEPVVCASTPCVTQIAAGANHFCALLSDGSVRCWGRDDRGSLGRGAEASNGTGSLPAPVVGITNATHISASALRSGNSLGTTTCARTAEGRVQCWGENRSGQLGLQVSPPRTDTLDHPTPSDVALIAEIARVDVGPLSVCALSTSGDAYCWGHNGEQQLARPDAGAGTVHGPGLAYLGPYDVTRIAAGGLRQSVFGLTKDRQLIGWGRISGRDSSLIDTAVPFPLATLSDVTSVATGGRETSGFGVFSCAIASGSIYCWGVNERGQLGTGVPDPARLPTLATLLMDRSTFPQQLALTERRSCARMIDGTIRCCGDGPRGELGGDGGTLVGCNTAFEGHAVQVAASLGATCALIQGGTVMCWGGNASGELGQGTRDTDAHPTPVAVTFQ